MTTTERKSVTKVFSAVTPQKQYLEEVNGSKLCFNENSYLHRDANTTNDTLDSQPGERFERNGLSSCVDDEMKRMHQSKFLNTKLSSLDSGGVRKSEACQTKNNESLVKKSRKKTLKKQDKEKDKSLCNVKGVIIKNNNEKLGKYVKKATHTETRNTTYF